MYYLVFDVETTGLPTGKRSNRDYSNVYMVQIAWRLYDISKEIIFENSFIIKPEGYNIPFEAYKIHGITTEIANEKGVNRSYILPIISDILRKYNPVLVAHNLEFDLNVLTEEFKRRNIPLKANPIRICTMKQSTAFCKLPPYRHSEYKWPKLEELYKILFNKKMQGAHDASYDVKATAECFFELVKRNIIVENIVNPATTEVIKKPTEKPSYSEAKITKPTTKETIIQNEQKTINKPSTQSNTSTKKSGRGLIFYFILILCVIGYFIITKNGVTIVPPTGNKAKIDSVMSIKYRIMEKNSISIPYNYSAVAIKNDEEFSVGFRNGLLQIYDNNYMKINLGTNSVILALSYSNDNMNIFIGLADGKIKVYDKKSKKIIQSIKAHRGLVTSILHINNKLITIDDEKVVKIWNVIKNKIVIESEFKLKLNSYIRSMNYNERTNHYYLGLENGTVVITDEEFNIIEKIKAHSGQINDIAIDITNQHVISAGKDLKLKTWDYTNNTLKLVTEKKLENEILKINLNIKDTLNAITKKELVKYIIE